MAVFFGVFPDRTAHQNVESDKFQFKEHRFLFSILPLFHTYSDLEMIDVKLLTHSHLSILRRNPDYALYGCSKHTRIV